MSTSMLVAGFTWSTLSNADLDGKVFYFAKLSTSTGLLDLAGDDDPVIGVFTEVNKGAGTPATAQTGGVAKVVLAAPINAGVRVDSDSSGKAISVTSNEPGVGVTMSGGTTGDVVSVLLHAG